MASFSAGGGTGTGGGGFGTGSNPPGTVDPSVGSSFSGILQQLMSMIGGLKPPSYESLLKQGVGSPLLQDVLKPALANLLPGENLARQSLTDEFRQAGALGSSAQGTAGVNLENALQGQRGSLVSQIISSMLPTMTQGLGNQFNQSMAIPGLLASILGMSKPTVLPPHGGTGGVTTMDDLLGSITGTGGGANAMTTPGVGTSYAQPGAPPAPDLSGFDLSGLGGGVDYSNWGFPGQANQSGLNYATPSEPTYQEYY